MLSWETEKAFNCFTTPLKTWVQAKQVKQSHFSLSWQNGRPVIEAHKGFPAFLRKGFLLLAVHLFLRFILPNLDESQFLYIWLREKDVITCLGSTTAAQPPQPHTLGMRAHRAKILVFRNYCSLSAVLNKPKAATFRHIPLLSCELRSSPRVAVY